MSGLICYHKNGLERSRVKFESTSSIPGKVSCLKAVCSNSREIIQLNAYSTSEIMGESSLRDNTRFLFSYTHVKCKSISILYLKRTQIFVQGIQHSLRFNMLLFTTAVINSQL